MDNIVLIAIISATASLLVAVTSLIAVLINSKNTSRTAESIERLKNEFSRSNRSIDILDSELKATLHGLKDSIQAIQNLRNEIQRFRLDKDVAVKTGVFEKIHDVSTSVIEGYSIAQTSLSPTERAIVHKSKNLALHSQMLADKILTDMKKNKKLNVQDVNPKIYDEFDDLQMKLLDIQRNLWDCRAERLIGLSQHSLIRPE